MEDNKFVFYQNSDVILDHIDSMGNKFRVDKFGKSFLDLVKRHNLNEMSGKHVPRFFIIHKDSSATELLRYEDISEYMKEIETDPMAAIIRDGVQGFPNIIGTTILRPIKDSYADHWKIEYDEKEITPL